MGIDIGLLVARLFLGFLFFGHGMQKVSFWFGGAGLEGGKQEFAGDGFRGGYLTALAAGGGQVVAGILFILGALTPVAVATAAGVMLVALTVKWHKGFWVQHDGIEFPLALIVFPAVLALTGPGAYSVDALLNLESLPLAIGVTTPLVGVAGGVLIRFILHRPPSLNRAS